MAAERTFTDLVTMFLMLMFICLADIHHWFPVNYDFSAGFFLAWVVGRMAERM